MRIGIDATALPPQPVGAGNYIIHLIRALAGAGSEFEFVIFAQEHGWRLIHEAERDGFRWAKTPGMHPAIRLAWEQFFFPALVRRNQIDLLHSLHYTRPYLLGRPSVVTLHDMTFFLFPNLHTRAKRYYFPLAIRLSARSADALVADSESTRQDAIRILGIDPAKIFTAHLGVDAAFRRIEDNAVLKDVRQRYRLPERFILYVGLVEPRKDLPLLVSAYHKISESGVRLPLVIVGRMGWGSDQVLDQIKLLGLQDRILFTGYVPESDLPIVYNLASLAVYPTRYEGFGLPALEAMACGVPLITTAVSSLPEIVGEAGLLIPAQDEQALAQALLKLATDQDLQQQYRKRGPEQAAQFTWQRTAQQTLQVYRSVLAKNPPVQS